jgi:hypothetical protein
LIQLFRWWSSILQVVWTENLIRVHEVAESPKLTQ